jgi:hypothetical protein
MNIPRPALKHNNAPTTRAETKSIISFYESWGLRPMRLQGSQFHLLEMVGIEKLGTARKPTRQSWGQNYPVTAL